MENFDRNVRRKGAKNDYKKFLNFLSKPLFPFMTSGKNTCVFLVKIRRRSGLSQVINDVGKSSVAEACKIAPSSSPLLDLRLFFAIIRLRNCVSLIKGAL